MELDHRNSTILQGMDFKVTELPNPYAYNPRIPTKEGKFPNVGFIGVKHLVFFGNARHNL